MRRPITALNVAITLAAAALTVVSAASGQADVASSRARAAELSASEQYAECGKAYLEVASSTNATEDLFAAAICFEKARLIGLALVTLGRISKSTGSPELMGQALLWSAELNEQLARFDAAAQLLEGYAKRYAGSKDSPGALVRAIELRRGLGDTKAAIKNAESFIKLYKRKRMAESAAIALAQVDDRAKRSERAAEKALRDFLKHFGKRGGVALAVRAHVRLGEMLWRRSCQRAAADGTCIRALRVTARKNRCGTAAGLRFETRRRDATLAAEAQKHFAAAIALAGNKHARLVGPARFHATTADFEAFLSVRFPRGLSFDPKKPKLVKASQKKFLAWLEERTRSGEALSARYREVVRSGSGEWRQAAMHQISRIFESFSDELLSAEVPRSVRTGKYAADKIRAYCSALEDAAAPLRKQASAAYTACREHASSTDWTRACVRGLERIAPEKNPPQRERRATLDAVGDMTTVMPMVVPMLPASE